MAGGAIVWVLLTSLPWTALWLIAAAGLGWPLRRWLAPAAASARTIQMSLGTALLLTIDAALGRLGLLQMAGGFGAWAVIAAGAGLLAWQLVSRRRTAGAAQPGLPWTFWTAAPAVAVLVVAACSAPGWLWASEFGGYDALSYHLELPKEWLARGRIGGLEHNVYSFLPGYVESAYYHLSVLRGDTIAAVHACQLLHAAFAVMTAIVVVRALASVVERPAAGLGGALVLATPWTIVTGSLAYNEMVVLLMFASGLLVIEETRGTPWRCGAAVGLLAATACGAKLTATGFVAIPLAVALLWRLDRRRWLAAAATGVASAAVALAPYLAGNLASTGNPIFPFAAPALGRGHWSEEQVEIWNAAHVVDTGLADRLTAAWNQVFRYGIGANPDPAEPWAPQWSILPWLALGGLIACAARRRTRPAALMLGSIMLVQLLFWLTLTHLKSRFMLPALVPAVMAVAMAVDPLGRPAQRLAAAAALALALVPGAIFLRERGGEPTALIGLAEARTGAGLSGETGAALAATWPEAFINHALERPVRVLCVGEAAPLYYDTSRIEYQTTWDRGPLSAIMREAPDDPARWMSLLAERGYTHLLVNAPMLEVWERAGWNDPLITAERVLAAAETHARPIARFPAGVSLFDL